MCAAMRRAALIVLALIVVAHPAWGIVPTTCVTANPSDGYVQGFSSSYATSNTTATSETDTAAFLAAGTNRFGVYQVNRGYISFPDLHLPSDAILTTASLTVTPAQAAPTDGTLAVYDLAWTEPLSVGNMQANFTALRTAPFDANLATPGGWSVGIPVTATLSNLPWITTHATHVQYGLQTVEDAAGTGLGLFTEFVFYAQQGGYPAQLCVSYLPATPTITPSPVPTRTVAPGSTPTRTPRGVVQMLIGVRQPTFTPTPLPGTPTRTPTLLPTWTITPTRLASSTPTISNTPTISPTPTDTPTVTQTATFTLLASRTPTRTPTPTFTPSPTAATPTFTVTLTPNPTNTGTPPTATPRGILQLFQGFAFDTPTTTPTPTDTHVAGTDTPTNTPTETPTPTVTGTVPTGDCCTIHSSGGCNIADCNACVCGLVGDSYCCDTTWDALCRDDAFNYCATACGCAAATITPTNTPTPIQPTPTPPVAVTATFCSTSSTDVSSIAATDASYPPVTPGPLTAGITVTRSLVGGNFTVQVALARIDTSAIGAQTVLSADLVFPPALSDGSVDGRSLAGEWINSATYWPLSASAYTSSSFATAFSVPIASLVSPVDIPLDPTQINTTGFTALRFTVSGVQPTGSNFASLWNGRDSPGVCLVLSVIAPTPTPQPTHTPCCGQPTPTFTPTPASMCVPFTPTPGGPLTPTPTPTPLVCCECPTSDCVEPLRDRSCPTPCVPVLNGICPP